ncbi:MAG TPA: hypothetical protein VGP24_16840 [Glaciihabitans sp.]|jgi:hypothetical protein|nr:hypothetical protein [Glaciihabitans sp.]
MKHITFGDKSLLVGDDVADMLLEYAAFLTSSGAGDTVQVHAIGSDGSDVTASFLLGPGVTMMAETSTTSLPEPDNREAIEYIKEATMQARVRPAAMSDDNVPFSFHDEL